MLNSGPRRMLAAVLGGLGALVVGDGAGIPVTALTTSRPIGTPSLLPPGPGGYFRHINGSTPRDRRAAVKSRNRLKAKGRHRKAVR